ncbi:MAG: nucleotidyltransferase domain-containing protein [Simkaniaceae bacterium]|nr:nucleotidyltransferase domain-containing protein [Candidatus Sacchlamyda saccharinae]
MAKFPIRLQKKKIESFCRKYHIAYLALFGSVLTSNFTKNSDVDVLVNFEKKHVPHLLGMVQMESELTDIIGHPVDLKTLNDLSPYFREDVLARAKRVYGK